MWLWLRDRKVDQCNKRGLWVNGKSVNNTAGIKISGKKLFSKKLFGKKIVEIKSLPHTIHKMTKDKNMLNQCLNL